MRHKKSFRKFKRSPAHRRAMFRNMATSFIMHGRIETTLPKAKDLRRVVEKLITNGGRESLHARRQAYSYLMNKSAVHRLFAEVVQKYKDRMGGYTRITRTRVREGDGAQMAVIELV